MRFIFSVLVLSGCDLDGDGLGDFNERMFGTLSLEKDTDGDGLSDGDEVFEYRTDPTLGDTDGDGASDSAEINYGFDPLDVDSGPYGKGWPTTLAVDKDGLPEGPKEMVVGLPLLRTWVSGKDGEVVDVYDYALHDKPVLVVVGNSGTVAGEVQKIMMGFSPVFGEWAGEQVVAGEVLFAGIATMSLKVEPRPPELKDVSRCEDVPYGCFADTSWDLFRHIGNEDLYTAILLDEEMVVLATSSASNQVPLDDAVAAALGVPPPE